MSPIDRDSGRLRSLLSDTRDLVRIAYRDPEHVSERLTLLFVRRLGAPSQSWATSAQARAATADPAPIARELCRRSAQTSRIDGAVAGTPFLIALVPGYVSHLWQEGVMVLRIAALYGHDSQGQQAAAEFLVLRQVHPTVDSARAALDDVETTPMPGKPSGRRSLRRWVRAVRMLGVFGGFLNPPSHAHRPRGRELVRTVASGAFGLATWAVTWIFPVTFMLAMAWGCERDARALGRRALAFYSGGSQAGGEHNVGAGTPRRLWRTMLLGLSLAIPIAFVAVADSVRSQTGVGWVGAAGAIVALSLVIAMTVLARRL